MNKEEKSISRCISILYRYGQSFISKKLEEYNIGSGQYIILLTLLQNNGISQEKLSDNLKIDKSSIAKSIKKLIEENYIERRVDSYDKRAYNVHLTPKAIAVLPVVQESIKNWEDVIISGLSDNEKIMIKHLLNKMVTNVLAI